ncbi:PTS system, mannose-specific IIC component [Malonomonas rubra DSM 5091]|uniref:PTS system, mannose-specific IIC component n=1 Tax=Malonomonas rubra DSM 5091 TaxID=1122189 RepID=A0A1M6DXC3_MALRU|nr:PTS sugar transporter subunit IIC [Malonomonas rubra]SHI77896.1 PTS system, mannose-specific IIC component [Malonomonas rubra DSM 5091]
MSAFDFFIGAMVALFCGLDRTAILQVMISRPIVAAPLVAWLLGEPLVGLQVGMMVELLWLARLPVGAAIPPDDTQVSIASCVIAINLGRLLQVPSSEIVLLCLLVAIPLGKVGQYLDHIARQINVRLLLSAEERLVNGQFLRAEVQHFKGMTNFAIATLGTYTVVVIGTFMLVPIIWPLVENALYHSSNWLELALPLIGVAVILGTINVSRALTLFCASFGMAFLLMWLV